MQVRIPTVSLSDDDRRAIRFVTNNRRTKATRDESREWLEEQLNKALAELRFRWGGAVVDGDLAAEISEDKANATEDGRTLPASK